MTDLPPSSPRSSQKSPLDFDEFIGIIVAFTTIGAILFWSFSRRNANWNLGQLQPASPITSNVQPTDSPSSNDLVPLQPNQANPGLGLQLPVIPSVEQPNTGNKVNNLPSSINQPTPAPLPTVGVSPVIVPGVVPPLSNEDGTPFQVTTPVASLPVTPPPRAFTDIPDNFWAKRFIDVLSSRKIIEGFKDYSFRPDQPITRAEFAAIVERAFNKEIGQTKLEFTDVPANYWAIGAINDGIATGFLKGYPDKTFKPEQKIPRVQVLVALTSGLNLTTATVPDRILSIYEDAKDIPKYAVEKVAIASTQGLVVNYPNRKTLAPNREATRAEVAAMIHQALVRMGQLPAIQSENIVKVK
ncbi:MAG: S-layer homology domain-containing protein [Calothrix sp. C42_A2020_038]|nr:S-layer homology domain-containing protein [Calothrix sp. C42_A2020_038]